MIELQNVDLSAGDFQLRKISLAIGKGEHAVLMGRTGQGKSTLLEAICGLRRLDGGRILVAGRDVTHEEPANRCIGYVPQDRALFPTMTVRQHLAFALAVRRTGKSRIDARVQELAGLLGIGHLLSRRVQGMSGGEAQRIALGRALSFEPPVLLLDEPLSALDGGTRLEIRELLKRVQDQTGVTTLHVTHDEADAMFLGDRILVLREGRIEQA